MHKFNFPLLQMTPCTLINTPENIPEATQRKALSGAQYTSRHLLSLSSDGRVRSQRADAAIITAKGWPSDMSHPSWRKKKHFS